MRRELLAAWSTWAIGAAVFFRRPLSSGLDELFGDSGDGRLIVVLHEHWLGVVRGDVPWRSPSFFHPQEGTLGYSDTFLLDVVLYAPLRWLGADPFAALQLTIIILSAIGFVGMFTVCRRVIGAGLAASLALAATFTFANSLANAALHPQLFLVYWLPLVVLLAAAGLRSSGRASVLWGGGAGGLLGLVLYSAFYIGWFALFAAAVATTTFLLLRAGGGWRHFMEHGRAWLRGTWPALAGAAVGFLLALVPIALTYLPTLRSEGGRSWDEVMYLAPDPADVINVGISNYPWGGVLNRLFADNPSRLGNPEVTLAPTPLLMTLVVGAAGVAVVLRRRTHPAMADLCIALATTFVIVVLIPVNWGGWNAWVVPWNVVPGAVAIRAIGRSAVIAPLLGTAAVAVGLALLSSDGASARRRLVARWAALPLALLWVEQSNRASTAMIDRSNEVAALERVPEPPAGCTSFFLVDSAPASLPYHVYAIDAMLIAADQGLPTVNGYSGATPEGYQLDPTTAVNVKDHRYGSIIARWAERHDLEDGLCSYDRTALTWERNPVLPRQRGPHIRRDAVLAILL